MSDLQAPIINWQVKAGDSKAGFGEQRILIIGQGNGSSDPKSLIEDVQPNEVESLCGAKSLVTMAYKRFYSHNKANEVDVITLAEPSGGVKAQGGLAVIGTAQENKVIDLYVGDDALKVQATILKGDESGVIASKIVEAINKRFGVSDPLFTATVDSDDPSLVLIEFNVVGEVGNGLIVRVDSRIAGCQLNAITFTGGAGAYDSEGALNGLYKRYQTVLFDSCMDQDVVESWLESRVNMKNTVKGGIGFTMKNGSFSEIKDFANTKNSRTMVVIGNCDEMKFNAIPLLAVAEIGAKRALRLTDGAIIGDLVVDAQEAYGGINKSSLPYHNTPMSYKKPIGELIIQQVEDLNDAGVSLLVPATIGVVLGTMATTYKYDNTGIEDNTFKYLNAVDTAFAVQEYLFANCQKEFGQTRATGGDLVAGVSMTNELSVKAYIIGLYEDLVALSLVQGSKEAYKYFTEKLTVNLNVAMGFYSVYAPTAIVSQFRGLNGVVAIGYEF